MIRLALLIPFLLGGGYGVFKWIQKTEKTIERDFTTLRRRSAAHWLASKLNFTEKQIENSLEQWENQNKQPPILASVIKIECEVTRGAKECSVKVIIALEQDGKVILGEIEQRIGWESLPKDIREKFINSGKPTLAFSVIERQ